MNNLQQEFKQYLEDNYGLDKKEIILLKNIDRIEELAELRTLDEKLSRYICLLCLYNNPDKFNDLMISDMRKLVEQHVERMV